MTPRGPVVGASRSAAAGAEQLPSAGVSALRARAKPFVADVAPKLYSWPFLFVLGYLFVDFGRPHSWLPILGYLRPGIWVLGGGMLCLIAKRAFRVPSTGKYLVAFFALMVMLVPFSANSRMAFNFTRDFGLFLFGALLPMMAFVDSYERLRALIRFWVWIHVPLALYSITHNGIGVGSFLTDENDFALAMNMVIPYALALLLIETGTIRRTCLMLATGILVFGSTATMSRGGFIGLMSVGAMMWIRSTKKLVALAVVLVMSVAVAALAPAKYWKEVASIADADKAGDTGFERLYLWGIAWQMFLDHPVLGVGPGNYQYNNQNYEDPARVARGRHVWGQVAHSLYFTLLPEYGIVGTVLFAAMIIKTVRDRRRVLRGGRALLQRSDALSDEERDRIRTLMQLAGTMDTSLVALLTTGAFISVLYYPHVWILTAFTTVVSTIAEREFTAYQGKVNAATAPSEAPRQVIQRLRPAWQSR
jgi:O-antigen ligase